MCLHFYDVSDGKIDCMDGDDELLADISACPAECSCLMNLFCNSYYDGSKLSIINVKYRTIDFTPP